MKIDEKYFKVTGYAKIAQAGLFEQFRIYFINNVLVIFLE